ncbi:MAG: formylglycine-generating enzyme family protein [Nitrospirales bacterium]|nr:formylglycine-generating enzyme family protein [Nitrospirales bacterium]
MQFKSIPAGSFYMGSCKLSEADNEGNKKRQFLGLSSQAAACPSGGGTDSDASDGETPQHKVRISKGFQMGMHEVTLGQFKQFIVGSGRDDLLTDDFIKYNSSGDNAAVLCVSWDDAQTFIRWLNRKEGGNHYRLPTEAEWEYAARAGTTTVYSWGDSASQAGQYAWYDKNANDNAHAVGRKQPNPWGLYDMHGNVWEWVQDWYDETYYRNSPGTDPQGPGSGRSRVLRGGSWFRNASDLRSANRFSVSPGNRGIGLGFRLLRQP